MTNLATTNTVVSAMSFLLGHSTRTMVEECETLSEVFRELPHHLPTKTSKPQTCSTEDEELMFENGQKALFDAIKKQLFEFADEIDAQNDN